MDFSELTIDLLYLFVYACGEIIVFIGSGLIAATFLTALTIMVIGPIRGRAATG